MVAQAARLAYYRPTDQNSARRDRPDSAADGGVAFIEVKWRRTAEQLDQSIDE